MRDFIQACAGLFVGLGAMVFLGAGLFAIRAFSEGDPGFAAVLPIVMCIFSGASITLIGGGTYVVCSLDQRLERLGKKLTQPAGATPPLAAPGPEY